MKKTISYGLFTSSAILILAFSLLTACEKEVVASRLETVDCRSNREVSLQYGQGTDCGILQLRFNGNIEEGRCPINSNINCAFPGIATVHLEVNTTEEIALTIQGTNTPFELSRDTIGQQVIELLEVLPVPNGEMLAPAQEDYKITIRISEL